eukprot:Gb_16060 [translate_table: standard]
MMMRMNLLISQSEALALPFQTFPGQRMGAQLDLPEALVCFQQYKRILHLARHTEMPQCPFLTKDFWSSRPGAFLLEAHHCCTMGRGQRRHLKGAAAVNNGHTAAKDTGTSCNALSLYLVLGYYSYRVYPSGIVKASSYHTTAKDTFSFYFGKRDTRDMNVRNTMQMMSNVILDGDICKPMGSISKQQVYELLSNPKQRTSGTA